MVDRSGVERLESALASLQTLLNRIDREVAAELGVGSAEDMQVLRLLAASGPMRVGQIARVRGASNATVSARLSRLDDRGFVARERIPDDRRAVAAVLTDRGRRASSASSARRRDVLVAGLSEAVDVKGMEELAASLDQADREARSRTDPVS